LAGAVPQTPLEEVTAHPRLPTRIKGVLLLRGWQEGDGREREGKRKRREGRERERRERGKGRKLVPHFWMKVMLPACQYWNLICVCFASAFLPLFRPIAFIIYNIIITYFLWTFSV